jgi:alpha-beta hydrolase superfamily lysophospholipase
LVASRLTQSAQLCELCFVIPVAPAVLQLPCVLCCDKVPGYATIIAEKCQKGNPPFANPVRAWYNAISMTTTWEGKMNHAEGTLEGYGGTELYYQRWRPEEGPRAALAVVHGFGEHSGRYGNVVDWFVPRGYAVYAFDLRGHGRSQGQRGQVDSWAEMRGDVRAFLDLVHQQEPDLPVFLVGHSVGGLIALNYVLHHPEGLEGVVASGPLLSQWPVPSVLLLVARILSNLLPRFAMKNELDATALSRDTAVVEAYVNDPLVHDQGTPRMATEMLAAIDWTQAHAAEMALPCLIVHGGADRIAGPEASRTFFGNVTIADKERIEYDGYYHEVFNELGKEQVLADVEAWVERHL